MLLIGVINSICLVNIPDDDIYRFICSVHRYTYVLLLGMYRAFTSDKFQLVKIQFQVCLQFQQVDVDCRWRVQIIIQHAAES